jgi:hypothetical protein
MQDDAQESVFTKKPLPHTQNTHSGLSGPDSDLNLKPSCTQLYFSLINLSISSDVECGAVKNPFSSGFIIRHHTTQ